MIKFSSVLLLFLQKSSPRRRYHTWWSRSTSRADKPFERIYNSSRKIPRLDLSEHRCQSSFPGSVVSRPGFVISGTFISRFGDPAIEVNEYQKCASGTVAFHCHGFWKQPYRFGILFARKLWNSTLHHQNIFCRPWNNVGKQWSMFKVNPNYSWRFDASDLAVLAVSVFGRAPRCCRFVCIEPGFGWIKLFWTFCIENTALFNSVKASESQLLDLGLVNLISLLQERLDKFAQLLVYALSIYNSIFNIENWLLQAAFSSSRKGALLTIQRPIHSSVYGTFAIPGGSNPANSSNSELWKSDQSAIRSCDRSFIQDIIQHFRNGNHSSFSFMISKTLAYYFDSYDPAKRTAST